MTSIVSPGVPITLIGGPTALIEYAGLRILTDPTFDEPQSYGEDITGYEGYTLVKTEPPAMTADEVGARHRFEGTIRLERTGPFGYTVRVLPKHDLLATPAELGVVALP